MHISERSLKQVGVVVFEGWEIQAGMEINRIGWLDKELDVEDGPVCFHAYTHPIHGRIFLPEVACVPFFKEGR